MTTPPIVQAVRDLAAARPGFKYTDQEGYDSLKGCSYVAVRPGSIEGEGCIIGQALTKVDADMEAIKEQEFNTQYSPTVATMAEEFPHWFEGCTQENIHWLVIVQESQDNGMAWSSAVLSADDPTNH